MRSDDQDASMRLQMEGAQLALLGSFCLRDPAGCDIAVGSRKAQALLAVLGVAFPGSVSRERLIGILWGEQSQERARHSLRQAISDLRRDVPSLIVVRGETLALEPGACTVDVAAFQQFASASDAASFERASQLYGGALVDGLVVREESFEDWLRTERTRLAGLAWDTMARLAGMHAETGDHQSAVAVLQRWLALDPVCEDAHRRLIETLAALGRHSAAQQQYQVCRDALTRHLGIEPSAQTVAVFEAIRKQHADAPAPASGATRSARHPALAVLPFGVSPGHDDLGPTAHSVSADLTALLARASGWEVAAWQSELAGAAASPDPRAVGRALGVRYLVTGHLRRVREGKLRLKVELVECEDARHLWSALDEFPDAQLSDDVDVLAASLAARLEPQLNMAELNRCNRQPGLPRTHGRCCDMPPAHSLPAGGRKLPWLTPWTPAAGLPPPTPISPWRTPTRHCCSPSGPGWGWCREGAARRGAARRRAGTRAGTAQLGSAGLCGLRAGRPRRCRHGPSRCWSVRSRKTPTTPRPGPRSVRAG